MTDEQIKELANLHSFNNYERRANGSYDTVHLVNFAHAIRRLTVEECAAVVERQDTHGDPVQGWFDILAAKIRALLEDRA